MQKSYCIICGEQKNGLEVADDYVLDAIRWFKRNVTHNEKNNRLVVCKSCYPKYKLQLSRYESRQRLYLGLAVAFVVLLLVLSPRLTTLGTSVVVLALFFLFSLLNYTPRINIKNKHAQ